MITKFLFSTTVGFISFFTYIWLSLLPMAKKITKTNVRPDSIVTPKKEQAAETPFIPIPNLPDWVNNFKIQASIVALLAFSFSIILI